MPYGIPQSQWDAAKEEAFTVLKRLASYSSPRTISYSELALMISNVKFDAHEQNYFRFLEELSCMEDDKNRGLISALVVTKADNMPGDGFFDLAASRGRKGYDKTEVWINELEVIKKAWQ